MATRRSSGRAELVAAACTRMRRQPPAGDRSKAQAGRSRRLPQRDALRRPRLGQTTTTPTQPTSPDAYGCCAWRAERRCASRLSEWTTRASVRRQGPARARFVADPTGSVAIASPKGRVLPAACDTRASTKDAPERRSCSAQAHAPQAGATASPRGRARSFSDPWVRADAVGDLALTVPAVLPEFKKEAHWMPRLVCAECPSGRVRRDCAHGRHREFMRWECVPGNGAAAPPLALGSNSRSGCMPSSPRARERCVR
jgi:hypothetical protein